MLDSRVTRIAASTWHALVLSILVKSMVTLVRNLRAIKPLESSVPDDRRQQPHISVLIPARDEQSNLPRCLDSLLRQSYPRFDVTVLDDQSRDDTAGVVNHFAQIDRRVKLIRGSQLPPGWVGKQWACQQLGEQASGDLLLFADADTWFEPDTLGHAAAVMNREQPALLSVMPRQHTGSLGERLILPVLYMAFLSGLPMWRVEDSNYPQVAAANGQFMCFNASTWRELGRHSVVRDAIGYEDIAFARHIKSSGKSIAIRIAVDSVHCRMYTSTRDVIDGFSKNVYGAIGERPLRAIGIIALIVSTSLLPPVWLVRTLMQRSGSVFDRSALSLQVTLGVLIRFLIAWRFKFRYSDVALGPASAMMTIFILLKSMLWRYRGGYRWKGRLYDPDLKAAQTDE